MSSKLRRDLPSVPDRQWSREQIKIFDEHREDYQKWVKITEQALGERAFIADGKDLDYNQTMRLLAMTLNQNKSSAQLLIKYQTTSDQLWFRLTRAYDLVTAFYVPTDLEYLAVKNNGLIIGEYHGDYQERELSELLRESWQVPESETKEQLEYLLWVSNQGKLGFVHHQEEIINIDGLEYKRLIFLQPMIPVAATCFSETFVYTSHPTTVYLEINCIETTLRHEIMKNAMTGWVEDSQQEFPLIKYQAGLVTPIFLESSPREDSGLTKIAAPQQFLRSEDETFDMKVSFASNCLALPKTLPCDLSIPKPDLDVGLASSMLV